MQKYCENCGNKIDINADICLGCGKLVNQKDKKDDKIIWFLLSFLSPVVAMVLYLLTKNSNKPSRIILLGFLFKLLFLIGALILLTIYKCY